MQAKDLVAAASAAQDVGLSVALVEQPYRVAGRRSPAPAHQLDAAWTAVIEHLLAGELRGSPLVVGGRSSGARVACRTAEAVGAVGVLCLAFPLQPPRREGAAPAPSRLAELDAVAVPMLVVQGTRDPFGMPPAGGRRTVLQVSGDHSLRTDLATIGDAIRRWLVHLGQGPGPRLRRTARRTPVRQVVGEPQCEGHNRLGGLGTTRADEDALRRRGRGSDGHAPSGCSDGPMPSRRRPSGSRPSCGRCPR